MTHSGYPPGADDDARQNQGAGGGRPRSTFAASETDLVAGLFLILCAVLGWWFGQSLKVGTAFRMGPGYVPQLLSWVLGAFGVVLTVMGLVHRGPALGAWNLRSVLLILGAIVAFGLTVERLGLLISSALVVMLAGIAQPEPRLREAAILAICLAAFACLLFPILLQLPVRILP